MFFVCKLKLCTFSKFQNFKSQVDFTHSPTLCWKHLQRWRDDHLACCCKSSINKKFCIENDFIIVWWHRHRTDLLKQHRKIKVARIRLDVLYQGHLNDAFVSWQESRLRSVTTTLAFSLAKTCAIASHHCKAGDQPGRLHDRCLSHLRWQGQAGQSEPLLVGGQRPPSSRGQVGRESSSASKTKWPTHREKKDSGRRGLLSLGVHLPCEVVYTVQPKSADREPVCCCTLHSIFWYYQWPISLLEQSCCKK